MPYNGTLNFYFPCEMKLTREIKRTVKRYNDAIRRQTDYCRIHNIPLVERLDNKNMLAEKERILDKLLYSYSIHKYQKENVIPYATSCLCDEYHSMKADTLYIKNSKKFFVDFLYSVEKIVKFNLKSCIIKTDNSSNKKCPLIDLYKISFSKRTGVPFYIHYKHKVVYLIMDIFLQ